MNRDQDRITDGLQRDEWEDGVDQVSEPEPEFDENEAYQRYLEVSRQERNKLFESITRSLNGLADSTMGKKQAD